MASKTAGRPRTKPSNERRDDLIRSAERLFLEKGLDQTTIEDITLGASVSKGAFYLHFSSKTDVVEAMRARFVQGLLDRISRDVDQKNREDWHGKLAAWAKACAIGYLDAAQLHALVFSTAPPPDRQGMTRNALIDHLSKLLTAGSRESAWSLKAPAFTAIFLFNALHGVVNQDGVGENADERSALLQEIDDHVQRLVRPPPDV